MSRTDIARSRFIRGIIVDVLWVADGAGNAFGLSFQQIYRGFANSRVDVAESDLRRELNDLVDDKLLKRKWDETLNCHMYAITSRGREFKKAGCPWERIDEFTGKQAY